MELFQWSIIDVVTPFLFLPLQGTAWLLLLAGFTWAVVLRLRVTAPDRAANYPLLICVVGAMIAIFVPWTNIWLGMNERVHRFDREQIVREVQDGSLRPNVAYNSQLIALEHRFPGVSKGGNEIVVEEHNGQRYVFFFTFRGILDHYSGFLFVPDGGNPRLFSDAAERSTEIDQRSKNWFFVAHR